jgi:hypothetical protein
MKFQFKIQPFQTEAVESVVCVFAGQPKQDSISYRRDVDKVSLTGLNLDSVWENVIVLIGGVTITEGNTLDEQIAADEERAKTLRRIEHLEKKARSEKQPRRKWEFAEETKKLKLTTEVHN